MAPRPPLATPRVLKLAPGEEFVALQEGQPYVLSARGELSPGGGTYARVLVRSPEAFVLATASRPVHLVEYRHREVASSFTLAGSDAGPEELTADLSPDGQSLAIGYPVKRFETASLAVFDLGSGKLVWMHGEIPVRVTSSEHVPTLEVGWVDDHTVRFSVSQEDGFHWVDLDLTAGRQHDRGAYAPLGPRHSNPCQLSTAR